MKNNTNIYDIDGEIVRKADDNHKFTIKEVQDRIEYYRNKLKDLDETDKKAVIYTTYMRNLSNYLLTLYSTMSSEELQGEITKAKEKSLDEQVKEAIETLKSDIENDGTTAESVVNEVSERSPENNESNTDEESRDVEAVERPVSDVHEERPSTQSDLLVERDDVNTTMDEYVDFEEV